MEVKFSQRGHAFHLNVLAFRIITANLENKMVDMGRNITFGDFTNNV